MKRLASMFAIGVLMATPIISQAEKETWKQQFEKVSNEYFDQVYFHYGPTNGTLVGYHQYDTQLEDYSRKNIDAEIVARRFTSMLPRRILLRVAIARWCCPIFARSC